MQIKSSTITRLKATFLPELKVDGVVVNLEGFDRYSNPFTKMAWGDRQISVQVTFFLKSLDNLLNFFGNSGIHSFVLQAGGHNLDMEFSNFTINQD